MKHAQHYHPVYNLVLCHAWMYVKDCQEMFSLQLRNILESDQRGFPWGRRSAVGGCRQGDNVPSVKPMVLRLWLRARGIMFWMRIPCWMWFPDSAAQSTAPQRWTHFMKNQRMACCMHGKMKRGLPPASLWTRWSWCLAAGRQRRGKFRVLFLTQTIFWKNQWEIIGKRWVELKDIFIMQLSWPTPTGNIRGADSSPDCYFCPSLNICFYWKHTVSVSCIILY